MRAQWLPRMECHLHSSSSSDTSQLPFLAAGLGDEREGRGAEGGLSWRGVMDGHAELSQLGRSCAKKEVYHTPNVQPHSVKAGVLGIAYCIATCHQA